MTVLAAASTHDTSAWAATTLVVHRAPVPALLELLTAAGGRPGETSHAGDVAWFSEADLLFLPTAVAVGPASPEGVRASAAQCALYDGTGVRPP